MTPIESFPVVQLMRLLYNSTMESPLNLFSGERMLPQVSVISQYVSVSLKLSNTGTSIFAALFDSKRNTVTSEIVTIEPGRMYYILKFLMLRLSYVLHGNQLIVPA